MVTKNMRRKSIEKFKEHFRDSFEDSFLASPSIRLKTGGGESKGEFGKKSIFYSVSSLNERNFFFVTKIMKIFYLWKTSRFDF